MQSVVIGELVAGGFCLAKVFGKTVFVPYAIPGEVAEIEIVEQKSSYDFAHLVSIKECSPFRVESICPLYEICGACNMMHIEDEAQVQFRKKILEDCFKKIKIETPEIKVIRDSSLGYRSRVQLFHGGFLERKSNKLVRITNCPIVTSEVNNFLESVSKNHSLLKEKLYIFGNKRLQNKDKVVYGIKSNKN
ncbi:MAG: TRAM domain-containing protein, partial [Treponema sp.]|nr:TRAM domain-containing protein [Treponema sp.]